ncbi:MAG: penicillin-binding protein [Clostridia bacterium]|nr:penicillin-binding protein [Clostridia bacterium]
MGSKDNKDETKRIKSSNLNKKTRKLSTGKSVYEKKAKFSVRHPRLTTGIKITIIVLILCFIIGMGVLVGTFFGIFGDELKISKEDLVIKFKNSTVYDKDGNELATLSGGTKRKIVSLSEMAEYLPKAYISIEDERFETHRGVDLKRTAAATFMFLTHAGDSSFGGSTITQQLVKNITSDKDDSGMAGALRKVKEMAKAIQIEQYLSKDQILELYLNIIFVGGDDINGVALGSVYYFDKDVKDLSIAECAYLAGINHSPNFYKPFAEDPEGKMKERINKRVITVLGKMKELGYITEEQYANGKKEVEDGLPFKKGDGANVTVDISYHTEAALNQIIEQLKQERNMDKKMAELYLYSSGFHIYTTQDSAIQSRVEEEVAKPAYFTSQTYTDKKTKEKTKEYSMPTMVVVDHKTGQVVACATATGDKKDERITSTKIGYMNWPTRLSKQTGSSMKPIAVIAPGLATGIITPSTIYVDCETRFPDGSRFKEYYEGWKGPMSIRHAIGISANIPHVKALSNIGIKTSMEYCEKMGITNLGDEGLSLALGGLGKGVSPTTMAMAYATIANDGTYISPTFYTKVEDESGNIIIQAEQESREVLTPAEAYVEKSILTEPVIGAGGTATYCKIKGIDTAAKTGTTSDDFDRWLCGFTPYYTAACWYGYEKSATVYYSGNPAGKIWAAVMKDIHEDLDNAIFEKPEGVVTANICTATGKVATEGCTSTYQEVFIEGSLPGICDGHTSLPICMETGLISVEGCPTEIRNYISLPEKEVNAKWTSQYEEWFSIPTDNCPNHGAGANPSQPTGPINNETAGTSPSHTSHKYTSTVKPGENVRVYICSVCGYSYAEAIPQSNNNEANNNNNSNDNNGNNNGDNNKPTDTQNENPSTEASSSDQTPSNPNPSTEPTNP